MNSIAPVHIAVTSMEFVVSVFTTIASGAKSQLVISPRKKKRPTIELLNFSFSAGLDTDR